MTGASRVEGKRGGRPQPNRPEIALAWASRMSGLRCRGEVERLVRNNPGKHLVGFDADGIMGRGFTAWQSGTSNVLFVPVHIKAPTRYYTVLGVLEKSDGREGRQDKRCWIFVDDKRQMIELSEPKIATLPAEYVEREDLYEQLAPFTYRFSEHGRVPFSAGLRFDGINQD